MTALLFFVCLSCGVFLGCVCVCLATTLSLHYPKRGQHKHNSNPLAALLVPDALVLHATTTLTVRESDHVILHHRDVWSNVPALPLLARAALGFSSSVLMTTLLGW